MYKLEEIRTLHIEPTSNCQASCPMCSRNIQGGIPNPFIKLNEITIEQFKQWVTPVFIQQLSRVYLCGNVGEPIVAKDTLEIFRYIKESNPSILLGMNTNGSARAIEWWQELAQVFGSTGTVRFGIDGLEDTHSLYRIGTSWQKIIDNAKAFIDAGGNAEWDMLVFDHNKHQVAACEELSKNIGFKKFIVKHTSRFKEDRVHVLTKEGKTSHFIYPSDKSDKFTKTFSQYKIEENRVIHCKVKAEKNLFLNAHGHVYPCCWLDIDAVPPMSLSRVDYLDKNFTAMSLHDMTLTEIFDSGYFDKVESTWGLHPLKECSKQCGQIDKFNEQF